MTTAIKIENLWKEYRLGVIGHGTLTHDLQSWWAKVRGKEDPNAKITPMFAGQEKQIDGDRFWALRDINFEVEQSEILGIIGKNGAGKSTLLKILSRVTAPTRGNINIKGRIASLLEVGTGFHPELTGRENVFMNGAILGMSKQEIKSKLDEIIGFSGVESFVDTPVKRYSSGMYVRLAFAVAAHLEPEILVVDEVLAVGDAEFQKKAIGKMEEVSKDRGRTVLFVSHNMRSIQNLCNRVCIINNGSVMFKGDTDTGIKEYLKITYNRTRYSFKDIKRPLGVGKKVRITDIKIGNTNKDEYNCLPFGSTLIFKIKCTNLSKNMIEGLQLVLGINNLMEERIATLTSPYNFDIKKGETIHIKISTDAILLNPAQYSLSVNITETIRFGGGKSLDKLDKVSIFEITNLVEKQNSKFKDTVIYGTLTLSDFLFSINYNK
ncbi:MAG: ABC transporter ATP-binding protein [Desulfobacterales bacterium]|nr:ABC transporter ATP-binding protein [Desulfobacterales bacterium]